MCVKCNGYKFSGERNGARFIEVHGIKGHGRERFYCIDLLDDVIKTGNEEEVREREKTAIKEILLAKNKCIRDLNAEGHTVDVVFVSKHKTKEMFSFGLKVSPAIRAALISDQQRKIYFGNTRYPFDDRYHVKICYHCQMLGHISKECPDKIWCHLNKIFKSFKKKQLGRCPPLLKSGSALCPNAIRKSIRI